ncbi:MAG: hypothetical protein PUD41_11465 [bacterium]|nr:hypothetical protein [bacterium]
MLPYLWQQFLYHSFLMPATSLPAGATDGASLTSIVKSSLTMGGTTYTADAPQSFFGAKK